jgi:hypothetical protein
MAALVEIDPAINETTTIAYSISKKDGVSQPLNSKILGTDHVLSIEHLKTHYDALGSYLHMPSLEQLKSNKTPDATKLRERCNRIVTLVETVLSSRVWNNTLAVSAVLERCSFPNCGKPIRKRMPAGQDAIKVQCFECNAEYEVTSTENGGTAWNPIGDYVPCSTADCPAKIFLWSHQITEGTHWRCEECGAHNGIRLGVEKLDD